jgi:hypothetical protein
LSGSFFNIYSDKQGNQCNEIYIEAINAAGGGGGAPAASVASDGQPAVTSAAVTVMSDGTFTLRATSSQDADAVAGQPNAVTQINDGN